ncbi:MAG: hypothetical protein WCT19_02745 [Candidatus Paceibacterota bacterium]|jgi:hypothetical protein
MYAHESLDLSARSLESIFPIGKLVRLNRCSTGAGKFRRVIEEGAVAKVVRYIRTGGLFAMVVSLQKEPTCEIQVGEVDVKRPWE